MYGLNNEAIIAYSLQKILQVALVALAIVLTIMLTKEVYHLFIAISGSNQRRESIELIELIINFFLYFEFISLIIKYFLTDNHFPLQYFIYIGITACLRLVIVEHNQSFDVLLYSAAILLQSIALKFTSSDA